MRNYLISFIARHIIAQVPNYNSEISQKRFWELYNSATNKFELSLSERSLLLQEIGKGLRTKDKKKVGEPNKSSKKVGE